MTKFCGLTKKKLINKTYIVKIEFVTEYFFSQINYAK